MKRIEVKLSLPVVAPLLDVIRELADGLSRNSAAPLALDDLDPDFREAWEGELLGAQNEEVKSLLALFDDEFFREGVVAFDADNAEGIVRACAAVRAAAARAALENRGDESLETGEVEIATLAEPLRKAFMRYLFWRPCRS
jgi:hypothetical protein